MKIYYLQGETAVHWVAQNNQKGLLKMLMSLHPYLNAKDKQVNKSLCLSICTVGHVVICTETRELQEAACTLDAFYMLLAVGAFASTTASNGRLFGLNLQRLRAECYTDYAGCQE